MQIRVVTQTTETKERLSLIGKVSTQIPIQIHLCKGGFQVWLVDVCANKLCSSEWSGQFIG